MVILLRDTAHRHSIPIRSELDRALPATSADRVQLRQVLMNLMLNGIETMEEKVPSCLVAWTRLELQPLSRRLPTPFLPLSTARR